MPLDLPTNMFQGHSISCIYQAVFTPSVFLKPVQIPKVQFPQAEGCYLTEFGPGPAREVESGPGEVMLAQKRGFSWVKGWFCPAANGPLIA